MTENIQPLVSVIVLNFNAKEFLVNCIDSIFDSNYQNFEVILVDNASSDQTYQICKEKHPKINLIINEKNLGYCGGNNIGIKSAKGEFIIILNPDTVVDPNWIKELILSYEKYGDGLYQPKFLTTTDHNTLMSTGNMIHLFGFGFSRGKGEFDDGKFNEHEIIGYASGTCLFSKLKIFNKLNLFDPFLFAYHDDLDLCWRGALVGIPSHYAPKSIVYHPREGYSFKWNSIKFKLMERNRKYCLLTLYNHSTIIKMLPALLVIDIAVFFFYLSRGIGKMKILADWELLMNLKTINQKYRSNQKIKQVPDYELIKQFKNEILVPSWIINKKLNSFFNNFLNSLAKITRKFLN